MRKQLLIIAFWLTCSFAFGVFGQSNSDTTQGIVMPAKVENGDTIILANLDDISVKEFIKPTFESKKEERRYTKLIRDLKIVYPYAKMAKSKFAEMNEHFKELSTEKEKKAYTKKVEKEIREGFEGKLKNLTVTQGRLLIKLIDRETGKTSYELVKELRGGLSAFFWQALAKLFGNNLKEEYDPLDKDKAIEEIMLAIEAGLI